VSALDRIWAKSRSRPGDPRGELLTEHLALTRDAARTLQRRTGCIPGTPSCFWDAVALACLLHDAGKVPDGFQRMVGNPGPAVRWGQRHEVYSLGFAAHILADLTPAHTGWAMAGIATHHWPVQGHGAKPTLGQMLISRYRSPDDLSTALGPINTEAAEALYSWLCKECGLGADASFPGLDAIEAAAHRHLRSLVTAWTDPFNTDRQRDLTAVLVQGAVTLADHVASAHSDLVIDQPVDASYPESLAGRLAQAGKKLFRHQEEAQSAGRHLLLRAPTGTGKTEAALLWAAGQVEQLRESTGGEPRVFYTLPYLASINAMSRRLRQELQDSSGDLVGVAHSRAASYYLKLAADDDCADHDEHDPARLAGAARRAVARNRATRLFREPVRIGTPYQLLRAALAGPAHAGILIDSANSVFILDELHAYEPRRLGMILAMARLWTRIGSRVGVVSATLPTALADLLADALGEQPLLASPPDDWQWPVRHRLEIRPTHLTSPASMREVAQRLRDGQSVLIVANNIADARYLYDQLAPEATRLYGDQAAILLHSRYRARDRAAIEEAILARYEAGKPRKPGLLVATQTVEVSLNVDFNTLHTSGAPLESLIQRFGRVNRLGHLSRPAPVVVHEPAWGPRKGEPSSDYADAVYDAAPTRLAWEILTRHDGMTLDEKLFGAWLDEVYASDWGMRWRVDVDRSFRTFERDFLQFKLPFDDRSDLADRFDELFDGIEAVLEKDAEDYRQLIDEYPDATGRLLAADLLIPLPHFGTKSGRWDRELGVLVIDADYDPVKGLGKVRGRNGDSRYPGAALDSTP
jgi:CRISPR-associated endonuclease/helicase Cas3